MNLSVGLYGSVLGVSTTASYTRKDGNNYVFCRVIFRNENIADIAGIISSDLSDVLRSDLSENAKNISVTVTLGCNDRYSYLKTDSGTASLSVMRMNEGGSALLLDLTDNGSGGSLSELIKKAKSFFGINRLFLYISKNAVIDVNKLLCIGKSENDRYAIVPPAELFGRDGFCLYADYDFSGECGFIKGFVNDLLGIEKIAFFAGKNKNDSYFALAVSRIERGGICVSNLCFKLASGSETSFSVSGSIEFDVIENMIFSIMCSITKQSITLLASAEPKDGELINLFGNFYIGKTALMLGYENSGMTLGLICELKLNDLYCNAAVQFSVCGGVVDPQLISCSFGELNLPLIINSIVGKNIPGLECLENVIKITPFNINMPYEFNTDDLKSKNVHRVVEFFNAHMETFKLEEAYTAISTVKSSKDSGYALTDKMRMRHYFIDDNGSLFLRPQFYYCCAENLTLAGGNVLSKGIFFCAKIIVLGIEIKALFSAIQNDSILAFASVSEIRLPPFLVIKGSEYSKKHTVDISENSVLSQFVDNCKNGVVFYLQASKNDISFYFDGSISLLNDLFKAEAQLYYSKNYFKLNAESTMIGITTRLSLCADFRSFSDANFRLFFSFDTSKLEEKLKKFSERLENAVEICRQKFNGAKMAIETARREVRKLNDEIRILDNKISNCRQKISGRKLSWLEKIIMVPIIACEISAYQIAKGVLLASLSIAESALNIAEKALEYTEKLSTDVLKALNRVITSATSLFFVRKLCAEIAADSQESRFKFDIEFVALGKEYSKSWEMSRSLIDNSKSGLNSISDAMTEETSEDLKCLENGKIDSGISGISGMNKCFSQAELFSDYKSEFDFANVEEMLACNYRLIDFMNHQYIQAFGENNPLFNESNCNYYDVLGAVSANIDVSKRSANIHDLNTISKAINSHAAKNADMLAAKDTIKKNNDSINLSYAELDILDKSLLLWRRKSYDNNYMKTESQKMMSERFMNQTDGEAEMSLYEYAEQVVGTIERIYQNAPQGYANPLSDKEINDIIISARDHFRNSNDIE